MKFSVLNFSRSQLPFQRRLLAALLVMGAGFFASVAVAQTNGQAEAESKGQELVQNILERGPTQGYTNYGVLKIRDAHHVTTTVTLTCLTGVSANRWWNDYQTDREELKVIHTVGQPNQYILRAANGKLTTLSGSQTMVPLAGSDFWLADLGLEFFHWPEQKVLRKEVHRSCGCTMLESTNPDPAAAGYTRVVAWIDTDSLGIVEANAYDKAGKLLKNFYPKDLKKVDGEYQVQTMVMENLQTGTRTRLEFDLDASANGK